MRAVYIEQYGNVNNLIIDDLPQPIIQSNEILIKVKGAGVNPVDWMVREGFLQQSGEHTLPLILGWDAAGKVVEIGKDVKNFDFGDEVFVYAPISKQGAYAQYIAVDSDLVALKPKSLSTLQAAAVPLAATTAWQALTHGCKLKSGDKVLIHNASGGVGGFAVQIAKALGAYVIGTASSSNKKYVESLGVDEFIDYKNQKFEHIVENLDASLVAVGGGNLLTRSLNVIKQGGHLISLLDEIPPQIAKQRGVNYKRWWVSPNSSDLEQIGQLIDKGIVKVNINKIFPLNEVHQAHQLSQSLRATGKIVLDLSA